MNNNECYQILDGSMLKLAAMISMTVDHLGLAGIWLLGQMDRMNVWGDKAAVLGQACEYMRQIGRMAFPLYAFLLVEGFFHTGNRGRYALRLFLFALLSELPFDLFLCGQMVNIGYQNVLFTLLTGLLTIWIMWWIGRNCRISRWITLVFQAAVFFVGAGAALLIHSDYSYKGIVLIVIFYVFHHDRMAAAIAGFCSFLWEFWSFPGFLLILFYNGKRGKKNKFKLYFYYPIHLLVIYSMMIILNVVL